MKKWYVPQELYAEYAWRQWEYSNYARRHFARYVDIALEGDYYYDLYGNFVTHGWLIFNNSQSQPQQFGSSVLKANRFDGWFSGAVISADAKGQYQYALTISNQLRTTLTPMTFSKPKWDGVQFDWASDKYMGTVVYSRISSPGGSSTLDLERLATNATSLFGGRVEGQVGDFATVGLTYVNSHQSNTLRDGFSGDPFSGGADHRSEQDHQLHRDRAARRLSRGRQGRSGLLSGRLGHHHHLLGAGRGRQEAPGRRPEDPLRADCRGPGSSKRDISLPTAPRRSAFATTSTTPISSIVRAPRRRRSKRSNSALFWGTTTRSGSLPASR